METSNQPTEKSSDMEFSIGKSHGLSNNERKLPDYKRKLDDLKSEVIITVETESKKMKESLTMLTKEFETNHNRIIDSQQKIVEKLEQILVKVTKAENTEEGVTTNKKMQQTVMDLAIEVFKQNMTVLTVSGTTLSGMMQTFNQSLESSLVKVEMKRVDFIDDLKKFHTNMLEFERGYLYGDSLRIALSDSNI